MFEPHKISHCAYRTVIKHTSTAVNFLILSSLLFSLVFFCLLWFCGLLFMDFSVLNHLWNDDFLLIFLWRVYLLVISLFFRVFFIFLGVNPWNFFFVSLGVIVNILIELFNRCQHVCTRGSSQTFLSVIWNSIVNKQNLNWIIVRLD